MEKECGINISLTIRVCSVASAASDSLWPCGLLPTRLLCPWNFSNWRGCCTLLQGILLTQGSNSHLLHFRWILYHWALGKSKWAYDMYFIFYLYFYYNKTIICFKITINNCIYKTATVYIKATINNYIYIYIYIYIYMDSYFLFCL